MDSAMLPHLRVCGLFLLCIRTADWHRDGATHKAENIYYLSHYRKRLPRQDMYNSIKPKWEYQSIHYTTVENTKILVAIWSIIEKLKAI